VDVDIIYPPPLRGRVIRRVVAAIGCSCMGFRLHSIWTVVAARNAFRAHPDVTVIFASWDEFARDAKLAVDENKLNGELRIYSADISTPVQAMRDPGSAWVAAAATNPAVVGAVSVRAVALLLAGQDPQPEILVQPALVTRDTLLQNNIKRVAEVEAKVPAVAGSPAAMASWILTAN
jgi:simple sugar transport system substrate-binding protein